MGKKRVRLICEVDESRCWAYDVAVGEVLQDFDACATFWFTPGRCCISSWRPAKPASRRVLYSKNSPKRLKPNSFLLVQFFYFATYVFFSSVSSTFWVCFYPNNFRAKFSNFFKTQKTKCLR